MMDTSSTGGKLAQVLSWIISSQYDKVSEVNLSAAELQALGHLARKQGVGPVLFEKLKGLEDRAGKPGEMLDHLVQMQGELAKDYYKSSAQNQLLFAVLDGLSKAFDSEQIDFILLKGAALGKTLYEDDALRPMSDLDLLVRREDLHEASKILQSQGFKGFPQEYLGLAGWVDGSLNHHTHFRGGADDGIAIELHWNLVAGDADWRTPALDWFWDESMLVEFPELRRVEQNDRAELKNSPKFRVLTPTANLLYLAAHLFLQHGSYRSILLWYYDIHLLLMKQGEQIQWEAVFDYTRELRWADAVRLSLMAVHERFSTPLPAGVLERLETLSDASALEVIDMKSRKSEQRTLDTLQSLKTYDTSTRLRLMLVLAFPSPKYIRWRYHPNPNWLWPLYYPYRWLDITSDGFATLLGRR